MRDDPSDRPIPDEFKPSDYHVRALKQAEARGREIEEMTPAQCKAAALRDYTMLRSRAARNMNEKRSIPPIEVSGDAQ